MAREVETAYSGGFYLNWSNGTNAGNNFLNMGNMGLDATFYYNSSTFGGLPADVDTNPCSGITGHPSCGNPSNSDWAYKRTYQLSNGNIVWDLGGNDWTWVKDNPAGPGTNFYVSQANWATGMQNLWGPAGTYSTMTYSGNYGGLGLYQGNNSVNTTVRGGFWQSSILGGVFGANRDFAPSDSLEYLGFRCTWHPPAPNPTGLAASGITGAAVTLSWNSSGGTTDGFQIAYTSGSTAPVNCYSKSVVTASSVNGATSYTVSGLTGNTSYSFRVFALSAAGGLSSGATLTTMTQPLGTDSPATFSLMGGTYLGTQTSR